MQITTIVGNYTYSKPLAEVAKQLAKRFKTDIKMVNHFCLRHQSFKQSQLDEIEEDVKKAKIVFVSMVFDEVVLNILKKYAGPDKTYLILASVGEGIKMARLGKFCVGDIMDSVVDSKIAKVFKLLKGLTGKSSPMEVRKMLNMADSILKVLRFGRWKDAHNYVQAWKYFFNGGKENMLNMFLMVLSEYHAFKTTYKPPTEIPRFYIVHPRTDKIFTSLEDYLKWYDLPSWMPINGSNIKKRPLVGILFYNDRYQNEDAQDLFMVIDKLEAMGIGVVPAMSSGTENMNTVKAFFVKNNIATVDAMINFLYFRLEGGPLGGDYEACEQMMKQMNIPFMNYICMGFSTQEEWRERAEGMAPMETNLSLIFPELDGQIEGLLVAGHQEHVQKDRNMVKLMTPIEERVDHAVARTANWLKLKFTPNKDKKVAFVLFNYPPGKDTIGTAGNLDAIESLIHLLDRMREEGYSVSGYPRTRHEFVRFITKKSLLNQSKWSALAKVKQHAFKVPVAEYSQWFSALPETCQKEMTATWGEVPGTIMADEENLYVPGIQFENIFVGFQPARGVHGDPSKTYHDSALSPHHQYFAFYKWLEKSFHADAVVHFGTHGTLEFLPGKQVALSESCYPDIFIGTFPHLYLYTCSNPSEAMIAKRRTYAALVDYMTPAMIVSDLYGAFSEMETDIHNYYHFKEQSPARAQELKEKLLNDAKENNLMDVEAEDVDISWLYNTLNEMKGSMMTKGVHVMGRPLKGDELIDYVLGIVRFDRGELLSLHTSLATAYGLDWDEARQNPSKILNTGQVTGILCEQINSQAREMLGDVLTKKQTPKKTIKKNAPKKLGKEEIKNLTATLNFAATLGNELEHNHEIDHMIRALNVEFIAPGLGGNPIRSPSVIPTGRNPYQFNPDLVPTPLACQRGEEVARQIIEAYCTDNNDVYPETIGVVLWGFETMKTQGETVGEIFHLLGVRPKRSGIGDLVGLEPIPLDELGRPRLDVVVEICGIFRDTFPVLLRHIDRAFKMVVSLDEPDDKNYIRKHVKAIQKALEKEGVQKDQAENLAVSRIFGPSSSNYATDTTDLVESSEWEDESQIAELHLNKMCHIYGDVFQAKSSLNTFKEVLDTVDVVAQVRDNEEYGVADLDHYYEFLGGLSSSVESVKKSRAVSGRKTRPVVLVADSTRDKIKTTNIKKTIDYEVRTKLLNPEWMKGQMGSGYKGIRNMSKRMEHLVGWQATAGGSVDNWVWSEMADKYVFDEVIRKQMMKENIWAVEDQLQRLMEAYQRGMWDATDEEIDRLKQIYLELEAEIEEQEE
jgi:cobaltochelatase CobN